jgi:hypothetical protein
MDLKKQAIDLTDLAIGIIVLGVVVTIGGSILINMRDNRLTELSTSTIANETITPTGDTFAAKWYASTINCLNSTTTTVIHPGNYTVTVSSIDGTASIVNTTGTYGANDWRCSYNIYNTNRSDWKLANDSAIGLAEYGNWFKIIVIVGVAAVVLAIIFMAFGNRSSGSFGSSGSSSSGQGY